MAAACTLPHRLPRFSDVTRSSSSSSNCTAGRLALVTKVKWMKIHQEFGGDLQSFWLWRGVLQPRRRIQSGQCDCTRSKILPQEVTPHLSSQLTLSSRKIYLEKNLSANHKFWVIAASTSDELYAAATLRAQIFFSYPPRADTQLEGIEAIKARVAHDYHLVDLLRTRVKSEFNRESKMEALGMRVKCLLAVCTRSALEEIMLEGFSLPVPSYLAPPTVAPLNRDADQPLVAIGTLDIQDGTGTKATADDNLITFQLYALAHRAQQNKKQVQKCTTGIDGFFPIEQENTLEQGYIFNLCVINNARQRSVGKSLMEAALQVAKQMELKILYVHVEANNRNASALYDSLGYTLEEEEPLEAEGVLQRPRRRLLSFWVS